MLPWFFVPEHGVEDGEDLTGDGDEGDHFWLTGSEQTLIEDPEHRVAADCRERGQVHGAACGSSATTDHALAAPATGLASVRSDPNEACDLAAAKAAKLGHFGQEGAGQ